METRQLLILRIRLWDVKTGQEIKSSDKNYKDILAQFKNPLQQHSHITEGSIYALSYIWLPITSLHSLYSILQYLQPQGALVLKGEFINHQGIDLRSRLKSKESKLKSEINFYVN